MANIKKERGVTSGIQADPWDGTYQVAPLEDNPELRFPNSVRVYDQMRRTDGQVGSVLRAIRQPILGAPWSLTGDDVDPRVLEFVRTEIGLNAPGKVRRRGTANAGVVFREHLRDALLMLPLGFSCFEQVYEAGAPTAEQVSLGLPPTVFHLRKLGHRPAGTIEKILTDRDGGLRGIVQRDDSDFKGVTIPVEQLVLYTLDKEGADWTGNSILRTAYKDWFVKDKLVRLNAQIIERNGMGVPVIYHDGVPGSESEAQAQKVARDFRGGATASATLGKDQKLELVGVTGSTVDPLPSINYHDQQIAKASMAMFLDLGHDSGARSLGDTFLGMFIASLSAVADYVAEVFTEHVIRDLVWHNFGLGTPYPVLDHGDLNATLPTTVTDLAALVNAGIIVPDGQLESYLRNQRGLPTADQATARTTSATTPASAALSEPGPDHTDRLSALLDRVEALRGGGGHV